MRHLATPRFWRCYEQLPDRVKSVADKNYDLLRDDPNHPSLHFKKIGRFRSVRAGISYRALGVESADAIVWFWIGTHAEYDKLIS